ncbi:MAG: DUF423 domain-containing protein [Myxococcota bacterium]
MRFALFAGALHGGLAVALGAFGAHGLQGWLPEADRALRLGWWETAANYQLAHALVLVALAAVMPRLPGRSGRLAAIAFAVGALIFSGSLYVMTLTDLRVLGAVTPFGGLSLVVGWVALAWSSRGVVLAEPA